MQVTIWTDRTKETYIDIAGKAIDKLSNLTSLCSRHIKPYIALLLLRKIFEFYFCPFFVNKVMHMQQCCFG